MRKFRNVFYLLTITILSLTIAACSNNKHECSFTEKTIEPTCEAAGYTFYECSCGNSYKDNEIKAIGHAYGDWEIISQPTLDVKGSARRVCSNDNSHIEAKVLPALIDATVWSEKSRVEVPEADAIYITYTSIYGDVVFKLAAHEHVYGEWIILVNPTYDNAGMAQKVCESNSSHIETVVLPTLNDSSVWSEKSRDEASEKDTIYITYTSIYGDVVIKVISHEHTYSEWSILINPTFDNVGMAQRVCQSDNSHIETEVLPTLNDTSLWSIKEISQSSCISSGYAIYTSIYGNVTVALEITGHMYTNYVCDICGFNYYTEGLKFTLTPDGESYSVNAGTASNESTIIIPSIYNDKPVTIIENYAFLGCSRLRKILIPNGVTTIGADAFSGCSTLESITVPFIGKNASPTSEDLADYRLGYFFGTKQYVGSYETKFSSTTTYYIPTSLTEIVVNGGELLVDSAFYKCSSIEKITLPSSIKKIGYNAFEGCSNLKECYYKGTSNDWLDIDFHSLYSVPTHFTSDFYIINNDGEISYNNDNYSVVTEIVVSSDITTIDDYALYNFINLINITLHDNITYIGESAFYNCASLESIVIPSNVTEVKRSTFENCTSLENIILPSTLLSIGDSVFKGCASLKEIVIPDSVESISYDVFLGCVQMEKITLPFLNASSYSGNGLYYLFGEVINSLKEVVVTKSPTIPSHSFYDFKGLTSVVLLSGTSIGERAFCDCTNLENITLPSTLLTIEYGAFEGCTTFNEVIIPEGVTTIDSNAFKECSSLVDVSIPTSITNMDYDIFYECNNLRYNTIGDFYYLGNSQNPYVVLMGSTNPTITSLEVSNKTKVIYDNALSNCTSLQTVVIPNNVTTIGQNVFGKCNTITSMTIPFTGRYADGSSSYSFSYFFDSVSLAETLKELVITNATDIYSSSFANYKKLEILYIDGKDVTIGNSAFSQCISLTDVTFGEGVKELGYYSFKGCKSLKSLIIPNTVTYIGSDVLYGCNSLEVLSLPFLGSSTTYSGTLGYIFSDSVPDSLSKVTVDGGKVGAKAFYDIRVEEVTLGDNVTHIYSNAFYWCDDLETINIGNGILYVDKDIIYSCGYVDYYSSNGVYYLGNEKNRYLVAMDTVGGGYLADELAPNTRIIVESALQNCNLFTTLFIPESVVSIGEYAFKNCTNLQSVIIPKSVQTLGSYVFYNCSSLKNIYYEGTKAEWTELAKNAQISTSVTVTCNYKLSKIYYYNSEGWTNVKAYVWNSSGYLSVWPGQTMKDEGDGWYSYYIQTTNLTGYNIIFNNGSDKTQDIALTNGKLYYYGTSTVGYSTKEEAVQASIANAPKYSIIGSGFTGSGNWDTDLFMTKTSNNTYTATIVVTSKAEFKIRKDSSWTINYGGTVSNNTVNGVQDGANIVISTPGTYTITFNSSTKVISISK